MDEQLRLGEDSSLIDLKRAWEKALDLLAPTVSRPSFESFFRSARPLSMCNGVATIGASSELARIFLDKYCDQAQIALEAALGYEIRVAFTVALVEERKPHATETAPSERGKHSRPVSISLPLNDKCTFATFIVGSSNRMASAIADSIARKPGCAYNPFFIYGGPGLGKTHLLQAIGRQALDANPKLRVAYVSGEQFTSDYVAALREHKSDEFRRNYRSIDIWLLDDVQFLIGKDRTKEEFFYTFNALKETNKQIVLSSDRSPREMGGLEERIISRFESGVVADIAPPDQETRLAILQQKAEQEQVEVPSDVLECIAGVIKTNIRALEGALVTLLAYTSVMNAPLSVETAQQVLERYLNEKRRVELAPETIQRVVAKTFGFQIEDLTGPLRSQDLANARHIAMYLTRELTNVTVQRIGKAFGGRNHATVIHACEHVRSMLAEDERLKETTEKLIEDLKSGAY